MPLGASQRFTHARVELRASAPHFNLRNSIRLSCPLCTCRCGSTGQKEGRESKLLRSSCSVVESKVLNNKASTAITISYLIKQKNMFWLFIRCVLKVLIIFLLVIDSTFWPKLKALPAREYNYAKPISSAVYGTITGMLYSRCTVDLAHVGPLQLVRSSYVPATNPPCKLWMKVPS